MTTPATPRVSRRTSLPLIWVVPVAALIIAGWMVAKQFRNRGPEIVIDFKSGSGIEPGKTELEHNGVAVGTVSSVQLKPDLSGVTVRLRLTKDAAILARAGAQFWVVHPEVSLSGIRGLETILTGVRLNVRPGSGPPANHFRGLDRPPPREDASEGRAYLLRAEKLGGLTPGAPVYYRGIKVGAVETTRLAEDSTAALVRIRVYTAYVDLIRTNTVFWNAGGFGFHISLLGAQLKSTSLESLFEGGVSLATPEKDIGAVAPENAEFELHAEQDKDWSKWHPRIPIKPLEESPEEDRRTPAAAVAPAVLNDVKR